MATLRCHCSAAHFPRKSFKQAVKGKKKPHYGLFLDSGSPLIAEHMAVHGYDWLLVDAQHAPTDLSLLQALLTAIDSRGCPSLVRVGGPNDRIGIQQALDLGAYGIMVPTVFGPDDARRAVDAAYFPPLGHRSIAFPIRPQLGRDVADFLASANDEVLLILQVETAACLEQLEDTLAVPGVDAVFVGPFDLSYDLGLFDKYGYPAGLASEELQLAKKRIVDCCEKAGVAAGAFATGAAGAKALQDDGYMFIATGTDVGMLGAAAQEDLDGLRRL